MNLDQQFLNKLLNWIIGALVVLVILAPFGIWKIVDIWMWVNGS